MWACVVALFQIIGIVKSKKYKDIFGNDGKLITKRLGSTLPSSKKSSANTITYPMGNYGNIYTPPEKGFVPAKNDFGMMKSKDQLFDGNMFMRDFLEVQNRQTIKRGFY
jgi:hypothetical protein